MNSEKENILVWLDFDAYSYVNFGAIIELAKLDKFDFIGIVTTKQDMSFFEHQKIIPFKKLIYYPDCYINKSDFDLIKLKEIEKKYELNLWSDVFTERSFYLYWTNFYKFNKEEIFVIIEKSILFFIQILEEFQPKMILTQYIGENISNLLLYKIGKKMTSKTIISTEHAPSAIGPYCQATKFGELVFTSGQIPLEPKSMEIVEGGITEQTEQVMKNLRRF